MNVGDTVRFKPSYIKEQRNQFVFRSNLDEIMAFFNGERKVLQVVTRPQNKSLVHVDCPINIGRQPGRWRTSIRDFLPSIGPCECSWEPCMQKRQTRS